MTETTIEPTTEKEQNEKNRQKESKHRKLDRILGVIALVVIAAAWYIGSFRAEAALEPFLKQIMPETGYFELLSANTYAAWKDNSKQELLAYIAPGEAHGYGGELKILAAVDQQGNVLKTQMVEHKETAAFFHRVISSDLKESFKGKSYADTFIVGEDVDCVSGATLTSRAMADGVRRAARLVAENDLGMKPIPEPTPKINFGAPEAALLILFIVGFVGRSKQFQFTKAARWVSMLGGMLVLGFIYNLPLTLVFVNKMLLGFWPQWQTYLFWYLLLGGILLTLFTDNKNPYCEWFCPFGAAQECLGMVGGAKPRIKGNTRVYLRWFQRLLALGAIVIALVYRNPGISSYEVFGAFFHLVGSTFLFGLLGIVLVTSLFIKRPWCTALCPLRPVTDFIRMVRSWGKDILLKPKKS